MTIVRKVKDGARLPIHGKIKAGKKGGPQGRQSIRTWRFHSPDRMAIDILAETYGGTVTAMVDPKASPPNQWEVTTNTDAVRVLLPTGSIRVAEYELRDKAALLRRCDGETCSLFTAGNWDPQMVLCVCERKGRLECKPTVIMDVIIPEIANVRFSGVWRFITHSAYALGELPAMEEIIQQMQQRGIALAELTLNERTQPGKKFMVAGLRAVLPDQTMLDSRIRTELVTHTQDSSGIQALTMGEDPPPDADDDDQIIDAQVLTEDELLISMCEVILFDNGLPAIGGEKLLLAIASAVVGHSAHFTELAGIPEESWPRVGEAVRGINDGSLRLQWEGDGVKVLRKSPG